MPLAPGTHLGPYEVVSAIGAGGMGEVYKATDTRLERTVAIKVLPAHVASDPDLKQRFEREAKTISSLNHPHICTLYEFDTQEGTDFLVMEYLEGETLAQCTARPWLRSPSAHYPGPGARSNKRFTSTRGCHGFGWSRASHLCALTPGSLNLSGA